MRSSDFAIFFVMFTIIIVIGSKLGFMIQKALKMDDAQGAYVSTLILGLNTYLTIIATKVWHLFAGSIFGLFRTVPDALSRNILSSVADANEMGKLNSLIGTSQALSAVLAAPLYAFVYNSTLETNPAAFLWINIIIFGLNSAFFW